MLKTFPEYDPSPRTRTAFVTVPKILPSAAKEKFPKRIIRFLSAGGNPLLLSEKIITVDESSTSE